MDSVTNVLTGRLIFADGLYFALQILILVMFLVVLAISWMERRLWCRHLCPLGALLGLVGRGALFGRVVDQTKCTSCKACVKACPMDAIRDDGRSTDMSRCECGLECADACRQGAISWGYKPRKQYEYDPGRRALLIGAGAAFVATFGVLTGVRGSGLRRAAVAAEAPPRRRRGAGRGGRGPPPPGCGRRRSARPTPGPAHPPAGAQTEVEFLATCTRCDECLKVCPTNVLQPAVFEAGLEGVFTPRMDFTRSYCEWTCADCGKVCPTRSIAPLDLAEKQETVIGVARHRPKHLPALGQGRGVPGVRRALPDPGEGHHLRRRRRRWGRPRRRRRSGPRPRSRPGAGEATEGAERAPRAKPTPPRPPPGSSCPASGRPLHRVRHLPVQLPGAGAGGHRGARGRAHHGRHGRGVEDRMKGSRDA